MSGIDSINEPGQRTDMLLPFSINEPPAYPGLPSDLHKPPVLTTLTPATAVAGGSDLTLHCKGSNFVPTTQANFGGALQKTVFVTPAEVTTVVKLSALVAGNYTVKVQDGRGQSVGVRFTIT